NEPDLVRFCYYPGLDRYVPSAGWTVNNKSLASGHGLMVPTSTSDPYPWNLEKRPDHMHRCAFIPLHNLGRDIYDSPQVHSMARPFTICNREATAPVLPPRNVRLVFQAEYSTRN